VITGPLDIFWAVVKLAAAVGIAYLIIRASAMVK